MVLLTPAEGRFLLTTNVVDLPYLPQEAYLRLIHQLPVLLFRKPLIPSKLP
jgi:hypothetical protein